MKTVQRKLASGGAVVLVIGSLAGACGDDATHNVGAEAGAAGQAGDAGAASTSGVAGSAPEADGGEAGIPSTQATDLTTYCETVHDAYQAWYLFCHGPELQAGLGDAGSEVATRCLAVEPSVDAGRLAFDGVAAAGCLAAIDTENCDGFDFIDGVPECAQVFAPLVELGGECFPAVTGHFTIRGALTECLDGHCPETDECPSSCQPYVADGQACRSNGSCEPGSYCEYTEGLCTPRVADGEPCTQPSECASGSSCLLGSGLPGTCVARSVSGMACSDTQPCSSGFACLAGECRSKVDTGEACRDTRNCPNGERCLARDEEGLESPTCGGPGGQGVPCGELADCEEGLVCSSDTPSLCQPRTAIGAPCSASECELGAWCNSDSGECQAAGAAGDPCLEGDRPAYTADACEVGLYCMSDGRCHELGAQGEPCNTLNPATCGAGLFCTRVDFTCQPLAAEGEVCNPFSELTCAGDLGCLCDDPACQNYGGDVDENDTMHTCLPRRQAGDPCLSALECETDSTCSNAPEEVCTPRPVPCRPG